MATVTYEGDAGNADLRTVFKSGGQFLPAAGGALENHSGTPADYHVSVASSRVTGGSVTEYTFTVPVPTVRPVTLGFSVLDIVTNAVKAVGSIRLDADGNEVDEAALLESRAAASDLSDLADDVSEVQGTVLAVGVSVGGVHDAIGDLPDHTEALSEIAGGVGTAIEGIETVTVGVGELADSIASVSTELSEVSENATTIKDLLDADRWIDKETNPEHWALVLIKKGTGALGADGAVELLRQPLNDVNGNPVSSESTRFGQSISESESES